MTLASEARVVVVGVSGCAVVVCVSFDEGHKPYKPIRTAMMVETTQPPTETAAPTIFLISLAKEESKMLLIKSSLVSIIVIHLRMEFELLVE